MTFRTKAAAHAHWIFDGCPPDLRAVSEPYCKGGGEDSAGRVTNVLKCEETMFTGIIEEVGTIKSVREGPDQASLLISAAQISGSLSLGDSVDVNGACLTVVEHSAENFLCELSLETVRLTTLSRIRIGSPANLERALTLNSRLGGHLVQGHVDGLGELVSALPRGNGLEMSFTYPMELERYFVRKGSIAVDGISLTIASLQKGTFTVAVIPHTIEITNLKFLKIGDAVNLETDIIGRYLERFAQSGLTGNANSKLTVDYLREQGF
jgi:riboflavin synthase